MPTWREVQAAKAARLGRQVRYYTPDVRGPRCPVCHTYTDPLVVQDAGYATHPTCEPAYLHLLRRTSTPPTR